MARSYIKLSAACHTQGGMEGGGGGGRSEEGGSKGWEGASEGSSEGGSDDVREGVVGEEGRKG